MTPADIHKLTGTLEDQSKKVTSMEKAVLELVNVLKKKDEREKKKEAREKQEKRRALADPASLGINKMLKKEKDKAKGGGGIFGDIIGGILKTKALIVGGGAAIAGALVVALSNEQVRTAIGDFWKKKIEPLMEAFWRDFIVPEAEKLAEKIFGKIPGYKPETGSTAGTGIEGTIANAFQEFVDNMTGDRSPLQKRVRKASSVLYKNYINENDKEKKEKIKKEYDKMRELLEDATEIREYDALIKKEELKLKEEGKTSSEQLKRHKAKRLALQNKIRENEDFISKYDGGYKGHQTGGAITVPGMGQGDKVPMMLPPGSFVLNRNASKYMHADGGPMIPTMLEPGEIVFPHTTPGLMALNQMIPRFQEGGTVKEIPYPGHPDTGPGYQPGNMKDYRGRPVVLSKPAAEAFLKMTKESDGAIKGSDVTSSKRSRQKNSEVGGAQNSNHLTGNAIDIHGTSKAYMKEKGPDYKWINLVYSGHDGHFDYKGKDSGSGYSRMPNESGERTDSTTQNTGDVIGSLSNMLFGSVNNILAKAFGIDLGKIGQAFMRGLGVNPSDIVSGGGGGGSDSSGAGQGYTEVPSAPGNAKQYYNYMKNDLGLTSNQAKGLLANMIRESGLIPTRESGDDGGPGGLFQWKGVRQTATVRRLVESGDWKGQIKYALTEPENLSLVPPGAYKAKRFESAHAAADWWMRKWERPLHPENDSVKHGQILQGLGFQKGGTIPSVKQNTSNVGFQKGGNIPSVKYMSGADTNAMFRQANNMKMGMDSQSSSPIIINSGGGGGAATPQVVSSNAATTPTLPDNPISDFSIGLIMNNNILSNRIGG